MTYRQWETARRLLALAEQSRLSGQWHQLIARGWHALLHDDLAELEELIDLALHLDPCDEWVYWLRQCRRALKRDLVMPYPPLIPTDHLVEAN